VPLHDPDGPKKMKRDHEEKPREQKGSEENRRISDLILLLYNPGQKWLVTPKTNCKKTEKRSARPNLKRKRKKE